MSPALSRSSFPVFAAMLFVWPLAARPASAARLRAVQTGTVRMHARADDAVAKIRKVDPARAFLIFGTAVDSSNPSGGHISGELDSPTRLVFRRSKKVDSPAHIKWYVAEFASGVRVQRGKTSMDDNHEKVELRRMDPRRSFVVLSYRSSGNDFNDNDFVRGHIADDHTLELRMEENGGIVH